MHALRTRPCAAARAQAWRRLRCALAAAPLVPAQQQQPAARRRAGGCALQRVLPRGGCWRAPAAAPDGRAARRRALQARVSSARASSHLPMLKPPRALWPPTQASAAPPSAVDAAPGEADAIARRFELSETLQLCAVAQGRPLLALVADCRAAVSRIPRNGADHDAERHAADLDRKLDDIDGFVRTVDSLAEHYLHAERQSIGQLFAALEAMR
jgi:hypothetical protein